MNKNYNELKDKVKYTVLMSTGMFFELYPELSGNFYEDMKIISKLENPYNSNCELQPTSKAIGFYDELL